MSMTSAQATSRVLTTESLSPCAQPDVEGWLRFARRAEQAGIESVLLSFSRYEPDTLMVACTVGRATQQAQVHRRLPLGIDAADHVRAAAQYAVGIDRGARGRQHRRGELLGRAARVRRLPRARRTVRARRGVPRGLSRVLEWDRARSISRGITSASSGAACTPLSAPGRAAPEIYVSGHSPQAERLALARGSCWLRLIDTPEALAPLVARARERGVEVCLRLGLICRPTREEAIRAAEAMLPGEEIGRRERAILAGSDSKTLQGALETADKVGWMNRHLWAGLVPYYGSSAITLLGSPRELAEALPGIQADWRHPVHHLGLAEAGRDG